MESANIHGYLANDERDINSAELCALDTLKPQPHEGTCIRKMKVNLFIPGFAKSGSSFIFSYLSSTPEASACRLKEPAYFAQNFDMGEEWYHDQYQPGGSVYFLDGTVEYSVHPESASRIFEYNPAARLIFVVRNPYARAWSHYWHRVKMGEESRVQILSPEEIRSCQAGRADCLEGGSHFVSRTYEN